MRILETLVEIINEGKSLQKQGGLLFKRLYLVRLSAFLALVGILFLIWAAYSSLASEIGSGFASLVLGLLLLMSGWWALITLTSPKRNVRRYV